MRTHETAVACARAEAKHFDEIASPHSLPRARESAIFGFQLRLSEQGIATGEMRSQGPVAMRSSWAANGSNGSAVKNQTYPLPRCAPLLFERQRCAFRRHHLRDIERHRDGGVVAAHADQIDHTLLA